MGEKKIALMGNTPTVCTPARPLIVCHPERRMTRWLEQRRVNPLHSSRAGFIFAPQPRAPRSERLCLFHFFRRCYWREYLGGGSFVIQFSRAGVARAGGRSLFRRDSGGSDYAEVAAQPANSFSGVRRHSDVVVFAQALQ